jgi:hypothetical protein
MKTLHKTAFTAFSFIVPLMAGCSRIGPSTVATDRFEYTNAISESWKRQMLLNMVKIRYADAPVFLDVSSVINQYLMEAEVSGQLAWNAFLPEPSQNVGARGRYADRPTITYQPLQGEKFTRSLMTPIPPDSVMSLVEAGWRIDYLFRLCVQSINGTHNRIGHQQTEKKADPDFYQLINSMRKIQKSGAVGMRVRKAKEGQPASVLFFRKEDVPQEIIAEQKIVCQILGLNPALHEFRVVYGALAKDDTEIAILSRSMLQILSELASYIDIPQIHIDQQRAMPNLALAADAEAGVLPLLHVYSSPDLPEDAFAIIKYRDHWFWIDDKDFQSKRMFSFLMYLFTLAETGAPSPAPVLTIPTG